MANGFRTPRAYARGETVNIDTGSLEQDLYKVSLATGIIDARAFGGTEDVNIGPTKEQMITNAIQYAVAVGASAVFVPKSMRPFTASLVAFNAAVMLVNESLDLSTINVQAYGAVGNGIADDVVAIQSAINALPATGGIIYFPPGIYNFSTPLSISTKTGVTFAGAGARNAMNFARSTTTINYTGTGATPALTVSTNFARNFKLRNIGLTYSNSGFTGHIVLFDAAPSPLLEDAYVGGPGIDAGSALYTAASCVAFNNGSGLTMSRVYMTEALVGLFGVGGEQNNIVLDTCVFGDLQSSLIDFDQATGQGFEARGCMYNPIRISPAQGIFLNCNGFEIHGFQATGTTTNLSPSGDFFNLTGRGEIHGGNISTDFTGIRIKSGGVYKIAALRISALAPLIIEGGDVTTDSNDYVCKTGGTTCVSIVPGGVLTTSVHMRGDKYSESGTTAASVTVGQDSTFIRGTIIYDVNFDATTAGPVLLGENVQLQQASIQSTAKTGNYTLKVSDSGQIFNNIGAGGSVTFSLPAAKRGLVYTIWKFANQTVVLSRAGADTIFNSGAAGVATLTNVSNEIGALLRVRCVTSTGWLVEDKYGTWA